MIRRSYGTMMTALLLAAAAVPAAAQQGVGGGGGAAPVVERPPTQRVPPPYSLEMVRPVSMADNVWMSELTILEMRDLVREYGYTTALIMNGTMEANGPYLTTGKHNHVLTVTGETIARTLGKTLVAPILMLDGGDPEGSTQPGRLVLSPETVHAVLHDMATSLKSQGFKEIYFLGDSGSNRGPLSRVAAELQEAWSGEDVIVAHIAEYYNYGDVLAYQNEHLLPTMTADGRIEENKDLDGYHDDYYISSLIMNDSPEHVRYEQRVAVNLDHINSLPLVLDEALAIGKKIAQFRADVTVAAIERVRAEAGRAQGQN